MPGLSRIKDSDVKQKRTQKDIKIPHFEQSYTAQPPLPEIPKAQVLYSASLMAEIMSTRISHCVHQFVKFQIHNMWK